ncbi:MAG: NAD(P)/FAD-dependent oxidoreductase [Pseudomonadota bacterium]
MVKTRYDVLVIGSGMGGMSAAALLSHEGYRTLVAESLPRIGGRCSTMEYKGFKCTTGVIGPEMGGLLEEIFHKVGAEFDVRPAGPPSYLINGKLCQVPSKGGFRRLLSAATEDNSEVERVMEAISRALSWMEPSGAISLREWLLQVTQNESVLGIFQAMISATTLVNADELPAREYFLFLKRLKGYRGFGFCPQGSIALPLALARVVEEKGGHVWTRSPVTRILSEKGIAKGAVVNKDGEEIQVEASVVISNCGPKKTVELVGKEHMDKGYLLELEKRVRPAMVIALQIGTDKPLLDQNYLIVTGARRINALFQPTNVCPEIAPHGRHFLLAGAAPVSSLPPLNGKKEIELCMQDLRELLPGFDDHSEILLASTFHGTWPAMRTWPGRDMPQKTPIINLYNVGDGVKSPGMIALPAVVETGLLVAEDIKRRLSSGT